jgi:hypothetical protein
LGWKWSVASEGHVIPIGWAIDGANRNGHLRLLEPTLDAIAAVGVLVDIDTLHLDRGYDSGAVRGRLGRAGIDQFEIQRRGTNRGPVRSPASEAAGPARVAVDRRRDQHLVVELRAAGDEIPTAAPDTATPRFALSAQVLSDTTRTERLLGQVAGRRLTYRRPTGGV